MSWHTIRLADVTPMPWKNGGGLTRELLTYPSASNWLWRLSVADVVADGAFSRFSNTQRWFAVLSGKGVRLTVNGQSSVQTVRNAPFCFDGEAETHCELIDGATSDFNFMLQNAQGHMQELHGSFEKRLQTPGFFALYALDEATVNVDANSMHLMPHTLIWTPRETGHNDSQVSGNSTGILWMEARL